MNVLLSLALVVCLQDLDKDLDKPLYHNVLPKQPAEAAAGNGEKVPAKEGAAPAEKEKPDDKPKPAKDAPKEMEKKDPAKEYQ